LFSKRNIPKATHIIEYLGERVSVTNLLTEVTDKKPEHVNTFYLTHHKVIERARNGNAAWFINHSCNRNCKTYSFDEHIYNYAIRDINAGEELTFDYQLRPALKGQRKINNREV